MNIADFVEIFVQVDPAHRYQFCVSTDILNNDEASEKWWSELRDKVMMAMIASEVETEI